MQETRKFGFDLHQDNSAEFVTPIISEDYVDVPPWNTNDRKKVMSYKSVLTVLTDLHLANTPLDILIALAQANDGHAEALCLGVDRTQTGYYYAGANAMILQETITRAQEDAKALLEHADTVLGNSGVKWSSQDAVSPIADIGRHVAMRSRFSDLVVLPQPYGEDRGPEGEAVVEAALFEGGVPVLVVPDGYALKSPPKSILIGWNESNEAMNAIRRALPFLKGADSVRVVVIDPPKHGPERSDPGGLLSQFLSRHGVHCEIDVLAKSLPRVSDVLNRHVTDTGAEMVVMGAYGHSRFREAILGGATRYMLEKASVPIFMAH